MTQHQDEKRALVMFRSIRKLACVALLGVVGLGLAGQSAQAGGYGYGYGHSHGGYGYYLKPVVTYNYIQQPYTKAFTIYDDYGCEKIIYKTFYKTVAVPVTSYVKVAYGY
jgi:hypothetical protein